MSDYFEYDEGNILNKKDHTDSYLIDDQEKLIAETKKPIEKLEQIIKASEESVSLLKLQQDRANLELAVLDENIRDAEHRKKSGVQSDVLQLLDDEDIKSLIKRRKEILAKKTELVTELKKTEQSLETDKEKYDKLCDMVSVAEIKINTKRYQLPISNRSEEAIRVTQRTTFRRLPHPDTIARFTRDQFMQVWNAVWNRFTIVDGESYIYSEVDVVEVTEEDIALGNILSMDGRIYRQVKNIPMGESENDKAITNVKNNDYYVKLTDGVVVGYNSRKNFLFDLYGLLSGLNVDRDFDRLDPDYRVVDALIVEVPKVVEHLPLYLFNSTRLVNLMENSLVSAFSKLKSDERYSSYSEEAINKHISEVTALFEARKNEARKARLNQKRMLKED